MSETVALHHAESPRVVGVAVVTISDTRTVADDVSGHRIVELLAEAGHRALDRQVVRDEPEAIRGLIAGFQARAEIQAVLMTGGTGISARDQTFETISALLTKPLPGYGELFRMLSFAEIGPAAMLSRAVGGLAGRLVVLTMPGSPAAVELAMTRLILPELGHLVREARR
jgi:molybdenum cofactor biosynthesis protein B